MERKKLILFDWGGIVECNHDGYGNKKAWNDLMVECGATNDIELWKYHLTTISTEDEFKMAFEGIKKEGNLKVSFEEYVEKYIEIFNKVDYYKDVRDYELSLKDRCYIGILSNINIYAKARLDKQVGLYNYDYVFLSCELECSKPDFEIFEKVQSQLPFDKEDILFIDDKTNNINNAKQFGWNAFQATGLELDKIKEVCENFLNN